MATGKVHFGNLTEMTNADYQIGLANKLMGKYASYFRRYESIPASRVALKYSKNVEGLQAGEIYDV